MLFRSSRTRTDPPLSGRPKTRCCDSGGAAKSQHLVFGLPERGGSVRVRDMAWRPIAVLPAAALDSLDKDLDAVVKEASEAPKATPAPSPAASPAASR